MRFILCGIKPKNSELIENGPYNCDIYNYELKLPHRNKLGYFTGKKYSLYE